MDCSVCTPAPRITHAAHCVTPLSVCIAACNLGCCSGPLTTRPPSSATVGIFGAALASAGVAAPRAHSPAYRLARRRLVLDRPRRRPVQESVGQPSNEATKAPFLLPPRTTAPTRHGRQVPTWYQPLHLVPANVHLVQARRGENHGSRSSKTMGTRRSICSGIGWLR